MKRLIVALAAKGGVGKTETVKRLFDLLPLHGRSVAACDLDASTGTFSLYHDTITTYDVRSKKSGQSWYDDCYREDIDDVIVDVPGGRIDDLLNSFGDGDAAGLATAVHDSGRDLVIINPIGVTIAETVTAQVVLNAFAGTTARVVILKNGRFGDEDDFIIYDGVLENGQRRYGATGELAKRLGAETVYLPSLAPRLSAQIDAERLRLVDAAGERGITLLGRLGATRVKMHLAAVAEAWRGSSLDLDGVVPPRKRAAS